LGARRGVDREPQVKDKPAPTGNNVASPSWFRCGGAAVPRQRLAMQKRAERPLVWLIITAVGRKAIEGRFLSNGKSPSANVSGLKGLGWSNRLWRKSKPRLPEG
jgi:hypothetical protein